MAPVIASVGRAVARPSRSTFHTMRTPVRPLMVALALGKPNSSFACFGHCTQRVVLAADSGIDLEFKVTGMMCDGCTSRVEEELAKKDNVDTVKADLEAGVVTVTVNADDLATAAGMMEDIVSEINGMGFEATPNL